MEALCLSHTSTQTSVASRIASAELDKLGIHGCMHHPRDHWTDSDIGLSYYDATRACQVRRLGLSLHVRLLYLQLLVTVS